MIRELGVSLLAIAGFSLALWWSGIAAATERMVTSTMSGVAAMLDGELSDDAKEAAVRRAGFDLVAATVGFLWRAGVALAAAAAPIVLADVLGLTARDDVLGLMSRLDYIVIVSLVGVALAAVLRRRRSVADAGSRYSMADRLFHGLAFASPGVLRTAARVEDRVLRRGGQQVASPQPIFVTSLARAGTTALLNALADVPGVATHTYRDMPFLTAPALWNRLAGGRLRRVERRERAHGDGLQIDLDSPEAFEEVVWKMFWPEKYRESSIGLWRSGDRRPDAEAFLQQHMAKVVQTRIAQGSVAAGGGDGGAATARYCSKNNTNIARLPYLREAFPDCRLVVPIRRPEAHAASSLRQHRNFLQLQAEDEFVQRYMADIGHFEFGLIHRPIDFPGFDAGRYDPETGDYWLHYWTCAFREVLQHGADCLLVTQDALRSSPQHVMTHLCDALGLPSTALDFTAYFHAEPDEARTDRYDPDLLAEASDLYRELERLAVAGPPRQRRGD